MLRLVRLGIVAVMLAPACGFEISGSTPDDAKIDMMMPVEGIDMPMPQGRVTTGLIGLWTFNDPPGSTFALETSGKTPAVPTELFSGGTIVAPAFSGGRLVATSFAWVYSQTNSRLAMNCMTGGGATLEAWAIPQANLEGTSSEAALVVGLTANVGSRNIAILHAANRWRGLVRTGAAPDGTPALDSVSAPNLATLAHVVVVADATQRKLYVNGVMEASSPPGALQAWDPSFPITMFGEYQFARQWTGGLALVALYDHALSEEDVMRNFSAGSESN